MNKNLIKDIKYIKKKTTIIILCGGKGERLRPLTFHTPKPLIRIDNKTILEHIISQFLKFNINDFILATGYKSNIFSNFIKKKKQYKYLSIKIVNSGVNKDIIFRLIKSLKFAKENVIICYGDTLVDININRLILNYIHNKKKLIMTNYQLKSQFGIVTINSNLDITEFNEKPNLNIWYNVGYFIFNKNLKLKLEKFKTFKNFLKIMAKNNLIKSFKHYGQHITINTISELEDAKVKIKKF
jgi:NDP-sugar pyrophosphorylase family protein